MVSDAARARSARYYVNRLKPVALAVRKPCDQCGSSLADSPSRRKYCRECSPDMAAYSRLRLYGVDQRVFDAMYFEQDGTCPLCEEREATHVDHCHRTGKVRALLCHPCNAALGSVERPRWMDRVIEYQGVHA
jgi:hypothetical protein